MEKEFHLLDESIVDLEIRLGEYLLKDSALGVKPPSSTDKQRAAKRWFDSQIEDFRTLICTSSIIQSLFGEDPRIRSRNEIFSAVFDLLASRYNWLPVGTLAAILVHYGVDQLCSFPKVGR